MDTPENHGINALFQKDEWTQKELIENKKLLNQNGIEVILIDTILKPIKYIETVVYNPFEMQKYPKGTVFVFYCDSGNNTKARLGFYRSKLPDYRCISLRGGRAHWVHTLKYE